MRKSAFLLSIAAAAKSASAECFTPDGWWMAARCIPCPEVSGSGLQCVSNGWTPCYNSMTECCQGGEADGPTCKGSGGGSPVVTTTTSTTTTPRPTTTSSTPGATTTSSAPGATTTSSAPGATTTSSAPGATTTSSAPGATTTSSTPGATTTKDMKMVTTTIHLSLSSSDAPTPPPTTTSTPKAVVTTTTPTPPAGSMACYHYTWWNNDCSVQCDIVAKAQGSCHNDASAGYVWTDSKDACISSIKGSHCPASGGGGGGGGSTNCADLSGKIPENGFPGKQGVEKFLTEEVFNSMFAERHSAGTCTGNNFFTYSALVEAGKAYPTFANSGNVAEDKRELAAFLAQTSHETTGGWATAPCGRHAWGYCFKAEVGCEGNRCSQYCEAGDPCEKFGYSCPCAAGKTYSGRGPIQLSWNYNYGQFSYDKYGDSMVLVNEPERIEEDPVLAFEAGLWFWMKPQHPKPSCHDVLNGGWKPSEADLAAGRHTGFGMTTNVINGGIECGHGPNDKIEDRGNFYLRYSEMMGVDAGDWISCADMRPY